MVFPVKMLCLGHKLVPERTIPAEEQQEGGIRERLELLGKLDHPAQPSS